ncbi:MAG: OmpA family protein [Deltaproteobacteria bacterium]|nr:OmpA family protein [Deltaproteobacteria bacterium]
MWTEDNIDKERKKSPPEATKAPDTTMTLFTSLVLILLTFFIMISAKANFDETKYNKVIESVYDSFGLFSGGHAAIGSPSGLDTNLASIGDPSVAVTISDREMARVRALLAPQTLDGEARIVHKRGQRIVTLSAALVFQRGSSILSDKAQMILSSFASIMRDSSTPIAVEGHTDNQPPTVEGVADNWDLSMDRALAVVEFLASEGLEPSRLTAFGYGGREPMVANNSPVNRAKNNRVNLVLDFDSTRAGALRGLGELDRSYDYQGFEFQLPVKPGGEEEIY